MGGGWAMAAESPATPAATAQAHSLSIIRVGFPKGLFRDVPDVLIHAAATPFKKTLYKELGLQGEIVILPDYKAVAEHLRQRKLEFGVFHGYEYAWIKDSPEFVPLVVAQPTSGRVQACIVVHANSKLASVDHMKNVCVAVPRGTKGHCWLYIERLRTAHPFGPMDCCPVPQPNRSPEEVLDAVVAGQCDAAVVDVSTLAAYQTLKPGLAQQLKVICESKPLPPGVIVMRKGSLTAHQIDKIRNGLLDCHKTPVGRTFMHMWHLECFQTVTPSYFSLLEESAKHYPPPSEQ